MILHRFLALLASLKSPGINAGAMDALRARRARKRATNTVRIFLSYCPSMGNPREASIAPAFMPGGMMPGYVLMVVGAIFALTGIASLAQAQVLSANPLPAPWQAADIGAETLPGATGFSGGAFTVRGGGHDIQEAADGFRFVYLPLRGDAMLTAHVTKLTGAEPWQKSGVMLRSSLQADAPNAFLAITPHHGITFQNRPSAGNTTDTTQGPETSAPIWLRLRRIGSQVTAYLSPDGQTWSPTGTPATVSLGATAYAGLATTSHDPATTSDAVFDHVTLEAAKFEPADPTALNFAVSVVAPGVFHVVAYRKGNAPPPTSPFVLKTTRLPQTDAPPAIGMGETVLQTPQATFELRSGRLRLRDSAEKAILPTGSIGAQGDSIVLTLGHNPGERFYGAGNESENHAGSLLHPSGTQIVNNGTTRVPFLWSTGGWSVFVANNQGGSSWNDADGTLTWTTPGPYMDLYLTVAKDGYGLLDAYSRLTGRAPIPPRWTFGFMISRWGYSDAADVQDKWHQFRDRKIPVDTFIYDYDWFVGDWDFNPKTFPPGSLDTMKSLGLKFVGIRKPRVTGANLDYARQQGWVLSSPLGTDLRFDLPVARYWWWSHHIPLVQAGIAGWWNDEAEQSVDEFFQQTETEWDGWRAVSPHRAWEINRAFAPGIQRFGAATWTGDINSDWETLANQPGTMLNWQMAGMPYTSQDIGGFQGTPSPELYARWIEEGVFVPVMRAHGTIGSPRWPWAFGDDVLAATKKAIELRYRLIPYLYTVAAQTTATGAPPMRPLTLEFGQDPQTFNLGNEWLVGDRLLAAPVLAPGGARDVYLPKLAAGKWYDFNTGAAIDGGQTLHIQAPLDTIPAYVRAGSILPLGPILQSTSLGAEDPLEIRVYPGADAAFALYEDDGNTYAYQTGASIRIPMTWNDKTRTLTVGARTGTFPGMLATRHLNVVLPDGTRKSVTYTGSVVTVGF